MNNNYFQRATPPTIGHAHPPTMAKKTRVLEFQEVLSRSTIDMKHLRELCFQGCPNEGGVRATYWKLLLGYLPHRPADWEEELSRRRASYQQLVNDVIINPHAPESGENDDAVDHPLNLNPESTWHRYFEDNDILLQIDHDTRRLYPELSFFQRPTAYPRTGFNTSTVFGIEGLKQRVDRSCLPSQQVDTSRFGVKNIASRKRSSSEEFSLLKLGDEAHWEVVERILFIHCKMNKGIGYVQGMNEICGPLYFVFAQHPDPKWREHAEADTFYCFANLMVEIGDKFTKMLDHSRAGIGGSLQDLMTLLKKQDSELHKHLVDKEIDPTFFGFRWITLLLSQEFLLPDVIRIWDSLFSDIKRFDFLLYVCCSMIICIRTELLQSGFAQCVKLLQHYPLNDIQKIIYKAQELRKRHLHTRH